VSKISSESILNSTITSLFTDAQKVLGKNLLLAGAMFYYLRCQERFAQRRKRYAKKLGIPVPAFMIFSVTPECNLNCPGCYSKLQHGHTIEGTGLARKVLTNDEIDSILSQAEKLGIGIVLLSGGEPLMNKQLFDITERYRQTLFPVFTNGLIITKTLAGKLKHMNNVVPIISIEGGERFTDARRGVGTFNQIVETMMMLNKKKVFFGTSITVTKENYHVVTSENYVNTLVDIGCKAFVYVDYVPVDGKSETLVTTIEQKSGIVKFMALCRKQFPALFISFPGDEEMFGGCIAAGRGFVHINPYGDVEPCPFAPYSDSNLRKVELSEALQSRFLKIIREDEGKLKETSTGCALFSNRETIKKIIGSLS